MEGLPQGERDLRFLSRPEAEALVIELESDLSRILRDVSPEEFVPAAAQRIRYGVKDGMFGEYPPHVLIHAIEACCAYWQQFRFQPLTENKIIEVRNRIATFDDPVMARSLAPDSDLFEFMMYMHRTQMEAQGSIGWIPVGRFVRLFGEAGVAPACEAAFRRTYGISLREWMQLSFAVIAGTMDRRCKFRHGYAEAFSTLGLPAEKVRRFLDEVSRTPLEIRAAYLAVRRGTATADPAPPLTWMQRRPTLAMFPLVRLARGFVVPSEAYALDLFGESMFRRLVSGKDEPVRKEVGRRFEQYAAEVIKVCLPSARTWRKSELEVKGGRSCDVAVELPDCVLLVELKAVVMDTDLVTKKAILGSSAMTTVAGAFEQLIRTAERIRQGGYEHVELRADKPICGVVASLGELSGFNHTAIWDHALSMLGPRGITRDLAAAVLADKPQVLHGFAFELLMLCLRDGIGSVPTLFRERREAAPFSIGDWGKVLSDRLHDDGQRDIDFWSEAGRGLIDGLPAIAAQRPSSARPRASSPQS